MSHIKTVCRTLFYQYFLLFIGFSVGFYLNAEWIGFKSPILCRSFNNIFNRVEFDENVLNSVKQWGAFKIWAIYGNPKEFNIIEDAVLAEEWYWAKFTYIDVHGVKHTEIDSTRVRWKPWEYYYENETPTEEELKQYIEYGNLNSQESNRAFKLMDEKMAKKNQDKA